MPQEQTLQQQIRCISHEIRNQLSICDVYAEILKKHLEKENIKNASIDNSIKCIQQAIKLIGNNLIDLKSFDNIVPHIIDSDKLINACIELCHVYIQDKKIKINSETENNIRIFADENKLQGCIINIIKNAIESIDKVGFIKITSQKDDKKLVIKISNNGVPISPEAKGTIFDEGFTTKKTGSGIGLYLCKKNLNAMNSDIELTKSDKSETEFTITVPIA